MLSNASSFVPKTLGPGTKDRYFECRVPGPYIALTIDDGPTPYTRRLLDFLRSRNVKATFYVIGTNARTYPDIIRQQLADGHEIGNHTMTHKMLTSLSDAGIVNELESSNRVLSQIAGYRPQTMRPPGGNGGFSGSKHERVRNVIAQEFGMPIIMWSCDPLDWKEPGVNVVADRLIRGAKPGGILLSHDNHKPTIPALEIVVDTLLARGYQFVTMSQLINIERSGAGAVAMNFGPGNQ